MKVSEAITMLQKYYKPEDSIIISWWDKEWVDSMVQPLTDEQWSEVAEYLDDNGDNLGDLTIGDIMHYISNLAEWDNES